MKKILFTCCVLAVTALTHAAVQQTTVFAMAGNEKNASVTADGVTNGIPEVTFKSTHDTYVGDKAADPSFSTEEYLKIPSKYSNDATTRGVNIMVGSLANYAAPFGGVLSQIPVDSIVWSFAIKYTYKDGMNGFGTENRGIAVILAMDGENATTANGYALVGMGNKKYSFARFGNGLSASANVTQKILTPQYDDIRTPSVFRIVFQPSEDRWTMYYAMSTTTSDYLDPSTATYTYVGTCVDNTFTNQMMTSFGFYNCYSAPKGNSTNLIIRNYSVNVFSELVTQSNIYSCNFTANSKTMMNGLSKGTPAVTYTHIPTATVGELPGEPNCQNYLTIGKVSTEGAQGRNILSAPLTNFAAPFTAKLSEIEADSIAWAFNMRNNRQFTCTGLGDDQNGFSVALVASDADLKQGCGYALVMGDQAGDKGTATKKYRLVRYNNGLTANGNTTKIVLSDAIELRAYTTVRIVYIPSTNKWKLYTYANTTEFVKPGECTYTYHGIATDATFTSTEMSAFGFMVNYNGKNDGSLFIKNFSLTAYYKSAIIQEDVDNSELLEAKDGQLVHVELHRNLKKNTWNTLCLPFAMTSAQVEEAFGANCKIAQFSNATMEGETLVLDFDDEISTIEEGVPYLIKPTKNITSPATIFDVTLTKQPKTIDKTYISMTGVFSPTELEEDTHTLFLGADNTLFYVNQTSTIPGMRAYFTLPNGSKPTMAPRLRIGGKQAPTSLVESESGEWKVTRKVLRNGQFVIIRDGKTYNAQGNEINIQ